MIDENTAKHAPHEVFAFPGAENIAYIRPVEVDDVPYFILMSAQGQELVLAGSREAALAAAYDRGYTVASVN